MSTAPRSNATINDVARLAGVSKRTVSRVLNNSLKVNPATREKIEKIIQELNYAPSKQARGLASSRSYLLGLVYDDPNAVVIHSVQKGILSVCAKHGYEMVVHPIDYQSENLVSDLLNFVSRSKLDGLIIMPPISSNQVLADKLIELGIPYVRIAGKGLDKSERVVVSDDRFAMQQVANLLIRSQRKVVGVVLGPSHRLASIERYEGLREALKSSGLRILKKHVAEGDFTYYSGLQGGRKLLSEDPRPDAIFASNDQMAVGVIHAAQDLGLRVPEDLIVIGYDDEPMSARLRPSLSTLQRPNYEMARTAALKLIAAITDNQQILEELPTVFIPKLICRQSSATSDG